MQTNVPVTDFGNLKIYFDTIQYLKNTVLSRDSNPHRDGNISVENDQRLNTTKPTGHTRETSEN